jgi:hypothetical protein
MIIHELDKFKQDYKPKHGYRLLVGITPSNKIVGAVYKVVEIPSKRYGKEEAECSVFNKTVSTCEEFVKEFDKYITKIQKVEI